MPPGLMAATEAGADCNTVRVMRQSFQVGGLRFLAGEKVADDHCDFRSTALESEMTGLKQVDFGVRVVALEGLRAGRQKEGIVLAPHRKKRRPLCAEVLLEFGI
jgi:hypothetical protein